MENIPACKDLYVGKFRKFDTEGQRGSGHAVQSCCAFVL